MALDQKLLAGNKVFREKYAQLMRVLVKNGQHPKYAIIACTDSRNDPAITFQLEMGDSFVFRSMGALLSKYCDGAEEHSLAVFINAHLAFYADIMQVPDIIIMGHTDCGAAKAIATGLEDSNISPWLISTGAEALERTKNRMPDETNTSLKFCRALEEEMLVVSHAHITNYPIVKNAIENGKVNVTSLLHELDTGILHQLDPKSGTFYPANDQSISNIGSCC